MWSLRHRRKTGSALELPICLFVFFLFALFPLFNLFLMGLDLGLLALSSHHLANDAAAQVDYARSLGALKSEADRLNTSNFANFAHIKPNGGYQNCGSNLYIVETNYINNAISSFGPNQPLVTPIQPSKFIYEYMVQTNYIYDPFFNLSGVPFIGTVPGIGRPFALSMSAHRAVEHLDGLAAARNFALSGNERTVDLTNVTGLDVPGELTNTAASGWNYPRMYSDISQQGLKVVAVNVLFVNAIDDWVNTQVSTAPNDIVWIDSRADGLWNGDNDPGNNGSYNADGNLGAPDGPMGMGGGSVTGMGRILFDQQAPWANLIGYVGQNPPYPPSNQPGFTPQQHPGLFSANKTLLRYTPNTSGPVHLIINDTNRGDNMGRMMIRIIVTRP